MFYFDVMKSRTKYQVLLILNEPERKLKECSSCRGGYVKSPVTKYAKVQNVWLRSKISEFCFQIKKCITSCPGISAISDFACFVSSQMFVIST